MSLLNQTGEQENNEAYSALMTNARAINAIASAVVNTLGPKGLDTMLIDQSGDVVITNDGVTILSLMDAGHPAARLLINTARAQQKEVGDGTTTATVIASTLINEGVSMVQKGVPVTRVIEGMREGLQQACALLIQSCCKLDGFTDRRLLQAALIAGRGNNDIAELTVKAAEFLGMEKICDPAFKLSDMVCAVRGTEGQVLNGLVINKGPISLQVPLTRQNCRLLILDDALEPEEISDDALRTESGFARYLQLQEEFKLNIQKIIDLRADAVLLNRGICDQAEEMLNEAGILVFQRVGSKDIIKTARHTRARLLKRTGLNKTKEQLKDYLGHADEITYQEKINQLWILHGTGEPTATILVSAATEEVISERERIAGDAASAVQSALRYGLVPGGGSVELGIARRLEQFKDKVRGMAVYGVECVIESLKQPFMHIVYNAGFNPLEKISDVSAAQQEMKSQSLALDCESGEVADMEQLGVYDPVQVKLFAWQAAGEVAEAILRIDTIIKKKEAGDRIRPDSE